MGMKFDIKTNNNDEAKRRQRILDTFQAASLNRRGQTQEVQARERYRDDLQRQRTMDRTSMAQQIASSDPFARFNIPQEEREDYILEPRFTQVQGIPISAPIPKMKPAVSDKQLDTIQSGRQTMSEMQRNVNSLISDQSLRGRLGLQHITAHSGWRGNLALKLEGLGNNPSAAKFSAFKASTQKIFQLYRKFITGAQAGFTELQMLQPVFPNTTDPPDQYVAKAIQALNDMSENEKLMMKSLTAQGKRTRQIRSSFSPINVEGLTGSAIEAGLLKESPIPGMRPQINIENERQMAREAITSGRVNAKRVADEFMRRTGENL